LSPAEARAVGAVACRLARRSGPCAILRPGDRDDLSFAPELSGGSPGERAFTLLAGAVLRGFARRLPGFGRSSARHLAVNFLSGGGRIESNDKTIVVILGRPPLSVILNMTALARSCHDVPWLGGRQLVFRLGP
jgi:hypothetical protein